MELGLGEDSPAARSTTTAIEGPAQGAAQTGAGIGVTRRRTRGGVQLAIDDLGNKAVRHLQEIFIGGRRATPAGLTHGAG